MNPEVRWGLQHGSHTNQTCTKLALRGCCFQQNISHGGTYVATLKHKLAGFCKAVSEKPASASKKRAPKPWYLRPDAPTPLPGTRRWRLQQQAERLIEEYGTNYRDIDVREYIIKREKLAAGAKKRGGFPDDDALPRSSTFFKLGPTLQARIVQERSEALVEALRNASVNSASAAGLYQACPAALCFITAEVARRLRGLSLVVGCSLKRSIQLAAASPRLLLIGPQEFQAKCGRVARAPGLELSATQQLLLQADGLLQLPASAIVTGCQNLQLLFGHTFPQAISVLSRHPGLASLSSQELQSRLQQLLQCLHLLPPSLVHQQLQADAVLLSVDTQVVKMTMTRLRRSLQVQPHEAQQLLLQAPTLVSMPADHLTALMAKLQSLLLPEARGPSRYPFTASAHAQNVVRTAVLQCPQLLLQPADAVTLVHEALCALFMKCIKLDANTLRQAVYHMIQQNPQLLLSPSHGSQSSVNPTTSNADDGNQPVPASRYSKTASAASQEVFTVATAQFQRQLQDLQTVLRFPPDAVLQLTLQFPKLFSTPPHVLEQLLGAVGTLLQLDTQALVEVLRSNLQSQPAMDARYAANQSQLPSAQSMQHASTLPPALAAANQQSQLTGSNTSESLDSSHPLRLLLQQDALELQKQHRLLQQAFVGVPQSQLAASLRPHAQIPCSAQLCAQAVCIHQTLCQAVLIPGSSKFLTATPAAPINSYSASVETASSPAGSGMAESTQTAREAAAAISQLLIANPQLLLAQWLRTACGSNSGVAWKQAVANVGACLQLQALQATAVLLAAGEDGVACAGHTDALAALQAVPALVSSSSLWAAEWQKWVSVDIQALAVVMVHWRQVVRLKQLVAARKQEVLTFSMALTMPEDDFALVIAGGVAPPVRNVDRVTQGAITAGSQPAADQSGGGMAGDAVQTVVLGQGNVALRPRGYRQPTQRR